MNLQSEILNRLFIKEFNGTSEPWPLNAELERMQIEIQDNRL